MEVEGMLTFLWLLLLRLLLLNTDSSGGGSDDGGPDEADGDGDSSTGDGDPPPALTEEEVKNPRLKALSREAAKWRNKFRQTEGRVKELEAALEAKPPDEQLRSARLEIAFLKQVMGHNQRIVDLDTAWDLATTKGFFDPVKTSDEDNVEGMAEALARLLERYPYLVDDDGDEPPDPPSRSSIPSFNRGRQNRSEHETRTFEQRFPAMRERR
jgi:hypothetical protein